MSFLIYALLVIWTLTIQVIWIVVLAFHMTAIFVVGQIMMDERVSRAKRALAWARFTVSLGTIVALLYAIVKGMGTLAIWLTILMFFDAGLSMLVMLGWMGDDCWLRRLVKAARPKARKVNKPKGKEVNNCGDPFNDPNA